LQFSIDSLHFDYNYYLFHNNVYKLYITKFSALRSFEEIMETTQIQSQSLPELMS